MRREILRTMAVGVITLVVALTIVSGRCVGGARTGRENAGIRNMAPLDQYLTEQRYRDSAGAGALRRNLFRRDARVMVLGRHGYAKSRPKARTVSCGMVERSWTAGIDDPDFGIPSCGPPDLLQPARLAILSSAHDQENRVGVGRTIQSADVRGAQSRFRQERIAGPGAGRDELHDVKARVLERS